MKKILLKRGLPVKLKKNRKLTFEQRSQQEKEDQKKQTECFLKQEKKL